MAALSTSLDKLLVTQTDLGAATPLDMRVAMIRMLKDMGFESVTIGNTAPADKKVLWWHKDIKTAKRYNAVTLSWDALTTDQWMLHILHRAFTAAGVDTGAAQSDLFPFYDISLGETRMITLANLLSMLGGEIPAVSSSATEFIIDLTQLDPDTLYLFHGFIKYAGSQSPYVYMSIRNSSNTELEHARDYPSPGGTIGFGTSLDFPPLRAGQSGSRGSPPHLLPMTIQIVKSGSPFMVHLHFSVSHFYSMIESVPAASAAAKVRFSLPANVTMSGKVVRP